MESQILNIPLRNRNNVLFGLPVEILLAIADNLPKSSQVLLSLTCKKLRTVLGSHFDQSMPEDDMKRDFLTLLERDLPQYITCRPCARMFLWQRRAHSHYTCPNTDRSGSPKHAGFYHQSLSGEPLVAQETVDLILRAHSHGTKYGLALSHLDHESPAPDATDPNQIFQSTRGHILNGQVFHVKSFAYVDGPAHSERSPWWTPAPFAICSHSRLKLDLLHRIDLAKRRWDGQEVIQVETMKCESCTTECRATLVPYGHDNLKRIEIQMRQNYGDGRTQPQRSSHSTEVDERNWKDVAIPSGSLEQDFVRNEPNHYEVIPSQCAVLC